MQTRRYPWGIQRLISTHQLPHNPKVPRSVQICIWGGGVGGWGWCGPDQINPKCQDLSKSAFSEGGGGGGGRGSDQHSWNTWVGELKEFWAQILPCHTLEGLASQIVSHTLRVWRLIKDTNRSRIWSREPGNVTDILLTKWGRFRDSLMVYSHWA